MNTLFRDATDAIGKKLIAELVASYQLQQYFGLEHNYLAEMTLNGVNSYTLKKWDPNLVRLVALPPDALPFAIAESKLHFRDRSFPE